MLISQAIERIKKYHLGISRGKPIDDETTRDRILFGDPEQELTGIVTTCYASVEVIRKAVAQGANLIITHEALFWNHGDHTNFLADNKTFQAKTKLLKSGNVVVWRDHDYIHSGIPLKKGEYVDGIFYGLMKMLGWEGFSDNNPSMVHPLFVLPKTTVGGVASELKTKLRLNGIKIIGELDSPVSRVWVVGHIDGRHDNEILTRIETENIDTLITLECIDYTVAEYVRDSTQAGFPRTILAVGHFNTEEPGMEYMLEYLPKALGEDVPSAFIPCADMYNFA